MSESLRDLVVSLSLNTDNFTRNIKSVNKQIQEAESYFKLASAGIKDFDTSAEGLSTKLQTLERKLSLQKDVVNQYERALAAASEKLNECYTRQQDYTGRLAEAKQRQADLSIELQLASSCYEELKTRLGESDSATIAAKQNMEAFQQEYNDASAEVQQLSGQLDALKRSTQNAADGVTTAQTQLNNAKTSLKDTEAAIRDTTQQLRIAQSAWTAAGKALTTFSKSCEKVSRTTGKIGRVLTTTITTPITALAATALKSSIEFESAFTSVHKTVDATEAEFAQLEKAVKKMSTEIAADTSEISQVMATGGQLGIDTQNLAEFTRVMIDLGNSCEDLNAHDAASSLAKFANVMHTDQSQFERVGSTLVDLGNNYATTEKAIMDMSQRLAGAGKQVGLTEAQVMGFAAALSSVGIEAQMGGSAFSKALVKMEVASATGGKALRDFASVSGMTSKQFKALWDNDPATAFQAFIVGLSKMDEQGISAISTLNDIGIKEIRLRDTLLRATNATELFSRTQATATRAWEENTALAVEAGKRYATTESRLKNLKNKATLFAQELGNDLNPMIQKGIVGISDFIDKLSAMDSSQRLTLMRTAAIIAAIGPGMLAISKVTKGISLITKGFGLFATAVGKAGGGFTGFLSVLGKSPAVWAALAIAVVAGTAVLYDYVSGARAARKALEGMEETAKSWKETAAETFYGNSAGLSFFGMSTEDFVKTSATFTKTTEQWMDGVLAIWTGGKRRTNATVKQWTSSWKTLSEETRQGIQSLKETADAAGYTDLSKQMNADLKQLNSIDRQITDLLKRRQSGKLTEKEKVKLQELIDTRNAIAVKYKLVPESGETVGFETIRKKVEAEVARAQARGKTAEASIYENAIVAAAQGMAAINKELNAQYDAEFALIQVMTDEEKKQAALADLNRRYNEDRRAAARDYANLVSEMAVPVWEEARIQNAKTQIGEFMQLLRQYSTATTDEEKKAFLPRFNDLTSQMDEGAVTEYIALLTQIQSLLDSGLTNEEVTALFPEIDFSSALDQIAAIHAFLTTNKWDANLKSINEMFGGAIGEEVLKIATDLDMSGAQNRWNEWASNPGAITTDAIINGYTEAENAEKQQPIVEAFISKYTEKPEGADKTSLTPTGLLAYVQTYAEATTGANVSGLTPENITAMVNAYQELASGADTSTLKPSDITAYIQQYLEKEGVDTSALTPSALTAFVLAYEEVTGGASTTALTPANVVAMVARYAEAENVDLTALTPSQIEAIVSKFSEATGCDKSSLLQNFTAYISSYKEAKGVIKPTLSIQVGLSGYDMLAYQQWVKNNKVTVDGIVRLSELYENPTEALDQPNTRYWKDGVEVPVTAVVAEMLSPDDVAILDTDGTMHILITTEISGTQEAIAEMREQVAEVDQLGMTRFGSLVTGIMPKSLIDYIDAARQRIAVAKGDLDQWYNFIYGGNEGILQTLDTSMQLDFDGENIAQLSTYVAEIVKAIQNGDAVSQEDMNNLQKILAFVQDLDSVGVGTNVTEGIAQGMTAAGWDTSAENVAAHLETALNNALIINSPSRRTEPIGSQAAAGIAQGLTGYDFTQEAEQIAAALETAASNTLGSTTFQHIGSNAMSGLRSGIIAGQAGIVSAMRYAARSAVNAAKAELKIQSPSRVFKDEVGRMSMKGLGLGIVEEAKQQAKVISNAARYLTGEAKSGAIGYSMNDNRKSYQQTSNVNLTGNNFYVRDETDIRSLAVEIATLTKRQQRGLGVRMA